MLQPQKNGCLLSSFLLFVGVYYFISIKILPRTEKSYPHREKTTPFPTRPVFLTPDRTDPRFKQNIAPWPESGRGCTVRSGNPRRSGMPRSSLLWGASESKHTCKPRRCTFTKIVCGCACRLWKFDCLYTNFFAQLPIHHYTILERIPPNFAQIGCFFAIICSKYTPNLCNLGLSIFDENPPIAIPNFAK